MNTKNELNKIFFEFLRENGSLRDFSSKKYVSSSLSNVYAVSQKR